MAIQVRLYKNPKTNNNLNRKKHNKKLNETFNNEIQSQEDNINDTLNKNFSNLKEYSIAIPYFDLFYKEQRKNYFIWVYINEHPELYKSRKQIIPIKQHERYYEIENVNIQPELKAAYIIFGGWEKWFNIYKKNHPEIKDKIKNVDLDFFINYIQQTNKFVFWPRTVDDQSLALNIFKYFAYLYKNDDFSETEKNIEKIPSLLNSIIEVLNKNNVNIDPAFKILINPECDKLAAQIINQLILYFPGEIEAGYPERTSDSDIWHPKYKWHPTCIKSVENIEYPLNIEKEKPKK